MTLVASSTSVVDPKSPDRSPALLLRASAGSGKTYQLTARLMRLLFAGIAPESILATTFTRKAAGEIFDRILSSLAQASDADNAAALEQLRTQVGIPTLSAPQCSALLQQLVANVHQIRICTLDSLFSQLARTFPFDLQLPPNWRLTDEVEELWLREEAINGLVSSLAPAELSSLLAMLSKGQTKRSIVRELLNVVSGTYATSRLADNDAWESITVPTQPDNAVLTAAAASLRLAKPKQKSLRKKFEDLADRLDARDFQSDKIDTLLLNYEKSKRTGEPFKYSRMLIPDGLDDAIGAMYAAVRSKELALLAAQNSATGKILAEYDKQIRQLKEGLRTLGFDDISVRLANRFSQLDSTTLTSRMDTSIDHVLLDEFQDTSPSQWQVLKPIVLRTAGASDDTVKRSFFCVGDTKQAIYGWRGGVAEIFDAVDEQIPGVATEQLNQSRRSSPVVIDAVNQVFRNLHRHPLCDIDESSATLREVHESRAVAQFVKQFPEHEAFHRDRPGYVCLETCGPGADRSKKSKRHACFQFVAAKIAELHRKAPDCTIGVLTRTNQSVAHLIHLLERAQVDVSQEGGNPLTDSPAVELLLSALMMSEHPGDGRWAFHVANSPLGKDASVTADRVRLMLIEVGVTRTLHWLGEIIVPYCDARDTTRLRQLIQLAILHESRPAPRIRDFVRLVHEKRVEKPAFSKVRVMTIHQSKGLEFDAVFLPEINESITGQTAIGVADYPSPGKAPRAMSRYRRADSWQFLEPQWQEAFGRDAGRRITEALCLLYVAMTRAVHALHMISQPCKSQDKVPATLIQQGLASDTQLEPEQLVFESGTIDWHASRK